MIQAKFIPCTETDAPVYDGAPIIIGGVLLSENSAQTIMLGLACLEDAILEGRIEIELPGDLTLSRRVGRLRELAGAMEFRQEPNGIRILPFRIGGPGR